MDKPTCKTCPYWKHYSEETEEIGLCMYNPPTVTFVDGDDPFWGTNSPTTEHSDWCGKHPDFRNVIRAHHGLPPERYVK